MTRSIGLARSQEPSFPDDLMVRLQTRCRGSARDGVDTLWKELRRTCQWVSINVSSQKKTAPSVKKRLYHSPLIVSPHETGNVAVHSFFVIQCQCGCQFERLNAQPAAAVSCHTQNLLCCSYLYRSVILCPFVCFSMLRASSQACVIHTLGSGAPPLRITLPFLPVILVRQDKGENKIGSDFHCQWLKVMDRLCGVKFFFTVEETLS